MLYTQKHRPYQLLRFMVTNQQIAIGGVISYRSWISGAIKFATQSMFSHTMFFREQEQQSIGAEDLRSVMILHYNQPNNKQPRRCLTKRLNIDLIAQQMLSSSTYRLYCQTGKCTNTIDPDLFTIRRNQYCLLRSYYSVSEVFDALWISGFDYDQTIQHTLGLHHHPTTTKNNNADTDLSLMKEFFCIGVAKQIYRTYGLPYDTGGTLSISFTPRQYYSYTSHDRRVSGSRYFCSERVADVLLFAGWYPFDPMTKDPQSVSPGDIMDSGGRWHEHYTKLYLYDHRGFIQQTGRHPHISVKSTILSREKQTSIRVSRQISFMSWIKRIVGRIF